LHPAQRRRLPIDRAAIDTVANQDVGMSMETVAVQDREVSCTGGERGDKLLDHLF
jgi:uncharacterized Zn-finger protein